MATIKDISKLANVSPGTVSRALNPSKREFVASETRNRVKQIADQLGYHYSDRAKQSKDTLNFAVITTLTLEEETRDEYWRFVRHGIYEAARTEKINISKIIRMQAGLHPQDLANYDAVIITGTVSESAVKSLKKFNQHIILVDAGTHYHNLVDVVDSNLAELTTTALNQLSTVANDDELIAFIGGNRKEMGLDGSLSKGITDVRTMAYEDWTQAHHRQTAFKEIDWTTKDAMQATMELITEYGNKLRAILVASDPLAIGAMKAMSQNHLIAGKDIALISFDDLEFTSYLTPSLTSIWLPKSELGYTALLQAEMFAKTKRNWSVRTIIPGSFKYRETFLPQ